MKKLTVGSKAINSTLISLIKNPGKWVGTKTGKMVTRWDEELKFECENEDGSVWYTDNILEAVEWLYCGDIDNRELFFLDQQFVDDVTEAAKKQAKREAKREILEHLQAHLDVMAQQSWELYIDEGVEQGNDMHLGEQRAFAMTLAQVNTILKNL